jgi:hypothetical protein
MAMASPASAERFRWPYAQTPGTSTCPPEVGPKEGSHELWAFFWLTMVNTAIIGVSGVLAWLIIHR